MPEPRSFDRSYASGAMSDFKLRVVDNMRQLAAETGEPAFAVPIAIVLAIDEANGGDATAQELVRRFALLDAESRRVIDFFFLGWVKDARGMLAFDLGAFGKCRDALRDAGVTRFGGNADLYIFDAWWRNRRVELDFEHAMYLDLAAAKANGTISGVGPFLQELIDATETARASAAGGGTVMRISDRLGLASAKASLLDFLLVKWGEIIGAKKLADLTTRRIGPTIDLARI